MTPDKAGHSSVNSAIRPFDVVLETIGSPNGSPWCQILKNPEGFYLLSFPSYADFEISPNGLSIQTRARNHASASVLDHLLTHHVQPFACGLRGRYCLHASAVVHQAGEVVAFCGPSGAGKSTLAAYLVGQGWTPLCDDALLIAQDGAINVPEHDAGFRLWEDSYLELFGGTGGVQDVDYTTKTRIRVDPPSPHASYGRLCRLFFVTPVMQECAITVSPPMHNLQRIMEQTFILDRTNKSLMEFVLDGAAQLVKSDICRDLAVPRGYHRLRETADLINQEIEHIRANR